VVVSTERLHKTCELVGIFVDVAVTVVVDTVADLRRRLARNGSGGCHTEDHRDLQGNERQH
jgi:hypothetical protein